MTLNLFLILFLRLLEKRYDQFNKHKEVSQIPKVEVGRSREI